MAVRYWLLKIATVSLFFAPISLSATAPASQQIPAVDGTTFANTKVDLPEDLQGKVGILVVAFSQNSRDALTTWGKKLDSDYSASPNVTYFAMPVLASVPKMMRGMVAGRIKSAVSDRARPHFLPLFEYEPSWRAITHYNKPDDTYILVVDSTGHVRWQSQGLPTEETYAALKQQVDTLRPH